jgi:hypothetical protein
MQTMSELGKTLIIAGILLALAGVVLVLWGKLPLSWLGHLPGDFKLKGKSVTFYFPLATSLLISVILSLILWLINRK